MYVRIWNRQGMQNGAAAVCAAGTALILLRYPDAVAGGISRGLAVCGTVIIPTLFPFMLLAGWLAESPLCRRPGRAARWMARRVFGLPGCCAPAILMALVGGYPAGAVALSRLHRQGQITDEEAARMTAFCVCGGPGFIVGTVGNGLLRNARAGWLLYAAQAGVAVGIGILLGRGHRRNGRQEATLPLPPRRPFTAIVGDTCGALVSMCGFVTAAAMVLSLAEGIGVARWLATRWGVAADGVSAGLAALVEVSSGCIALAGVPSAPLWLSLCIGWGGLAVQGQLTAALPAKGVLTGRFWLWRAIHATAAAAVAAGLFWLFPPRQSTVGGGATPLPYTVSAPASGMLLLLCFLTMLCFSEKKTGNAAKGVV